MRAHPAPRAALLALALAAACGGGVDSLSPQRRAAAVRALASEPGERPLAALLVAQRDPSALVREAAAEAIAIRKGPQAAPALGSMLADRDAAVATAAAQGLARLGALDAARAALVEGYAVASPDGRAAIAAALADLGISLRDAVEAEARWLWARNLAGLEGGSPESRAGAVEELGASGRAEAVARLRQIIARPGEDPRVVAAALRGLGEAADIGVRPALEAELANADLRIALAAAAALARLGDPAATPPLARLATAGTGPLHRAALDALESLPPAPEVSQALCGVAARTPAPTLAAFAARSAWARNADCPAASFAPRAGRGDAAALAALVELHPEPEVVGPLVAKLAKVAGDPRTPSELRGRVAAALGQLGSPAAVAAIDAQARTLLARVAAARQPWLAGRLPRQGALPADPAARLAFLRTRSTDLPPRTPDAPEVPEWIDGAAQADLEELGAFLAALGRLQAPSAGALLAPRTADPSPAVRAGAVEGLGFIGGEAPAAELVAAMSDPDERVRMAAVAVLPRYGRLALPALGRAVDAAAGEDPRWAESLARALGQTASADALPHLARLLEKGAPGAAAYALATLGVAAGAEPLLAHLARRDAPGRVEALDALAQLGSRGAGPVLEADLLSERPEVRAGAARAIGRLRYEPASRRLEALRVDYDGRVRRATIEALAKLPSGRPGGR